MSPPQKNRYFCSMYTLRDLDISYLGLYLLVALTLLVFLKFLNPSRYQSMVFFWQRTSSNSEFHKPFNETKALSWVGFIYRALIFGLIIEVLFTKNLSATTFNMSMLSWAGIFVLFWMTRTLIEGGLMSMIGKREGLLKIFYIRTIFKEKWAFAFGCLSMLLIYVSLSSTVASIMALCYLIGIIVIHLRFLKLYFRNNLTVKVYIILYICASEIGPVWLLIQTLKL